MKKLILLHLYPRLMNIYGDQGNIDALKFRCLQRSIKLIIKPLTLNQALSPGQFDLVFAGGGQDRQQYIIYKDLLSHQKVLKKASQNHIPMLTICGSFQLFAKYFQPFKGPKLQGINIFNAYTKASKIRKINNLLIHTDLVTPKTIIGFENHSGNTHLGKNQKPLGAVKLGLGNNGQDKTEGAVINNTIGCYLHGSLLPKNPHLADWLIQKALKNKYSQVKLKPLDDQLEWQAHQAAINRTKKLAHPLLKYL